MPLHHVPRKDLHETLHRMTREHVERVTSVIPCQEDTQCFLVLSESFEIETRDA